MSIPGPASDRLEDQNSPLVISLPSGLPGGALWPFAAPAGTSRSRLPSPWATSRPCCDHVWVTGNRTVNLVPLPSSLLTCAFPSRSSTIFREIDNARPVPLPGLFVVKNGLNILSKFPGGMPFPVSAISSWTYVLPSAEELPA